MAVKADRARERWLVPRWYERLWDAMRDLDVEDAAGQGRVFVGVVVAGLIAVAGLYAGVLLMVPG